jgi:hypothetical protein
LAEERGVDQNRTPVSSTETAKMIMRIGLLVGIVLIVAGGLLLFLNLTGNVTPDLVSTSGEFTGLKQGGVLISVGLVISTLFVIGLTGKPDEE